MSVRTFFRTYSENHLTFGTRNAVEATCVEHGRSADKYCKDCNKFSGNSLTNEDCKIRFSNKDLFKPQSLILESCLIIHNKFKSTFI